jgi:hypothetical protein
VAAARAVDREVAEPVRERGGNPRPDEHAVVAIRALEIAGELVDLRKPSALGVRDQQLDLAQRLLERRLDPVAELLDPSPATAETPTASCAPTSSALRSSAESRSILL